MHLKKENCPSSLNYYATIKTFFRKTTTENKLNTLRESLPGQYVRSGYGLQRWSSGRTTRFREILEEKVISTNVKRITKS